MKILSIGDLLLDVVVRYDPASAEEDASPDMVQVLPGGSAANFAVHAARLGANVLFVSRVGPDWAGEMLARSLASEGVQAHIKVVDEATGRVLAMVDSLGRNRMWSYPGASGTISPDDLDPSWFVGLDAFHLTGYSLLRDRPRDAALRALELARENGEPFCTLDPNPAHLMSDFGPARFREMAESLHFDAIFPNLSEGCLLSSKDRGDEIVGDLLLVAPIVVLTMGEEGCIAARDGERIAIEAAPATLLDTTGAGDAFAAGFVVEYLNTRDLHSAAISAGRLASHVVGKIGAR